MTCATCKTPRYMEFECLPCCVKWLSQMTPAEQKENAPVIATVMGAEHLEQVRVAYRETK